MDIDIAQFIKPPVNAVFNGQTIAVWQGDGPVLLDLTVTDAKRLRKLLKKAIKETE